jgi:hypothetical protein
VDFEETAEGWRARPGLMDSLPRIVEADYHAMVLGTRDYLVKCGFRKVLLGLSGGIDSAIVATIAADAIGADNVRCVMLPSRFTVRGVLARRGRGGAQSGLPAGHRVDWRAARRRWGRRWPSCLRAPRRG